MYNKVKSYIEKNHMLEGVGRVVVGLSGGADSVCLLLMLKRYISENGIYGNTELVAVHVHHGIRGTEADSDAQFCSRLCKENGIEYKEYAYDVPRLAKEHGLGEEEMGRLLRYQAFRENSRAHCPNAGGVIAVAHHQNDQAETVLFHIARGSSVAGGRGMEPVAGDIIRPLLCVTKREIESWLTDRNILFCTDSTNFEDTYARNAIRLKVIPYLTEHVNEGAVANICRYADRMAQVDDYIKKQAAVAYKKYIISDTICGQTDKENFKAVPDALNRRDDMSYVKNHSIIIKKELAGEHPVIIKAVIYDALKSMCGAKDLEEKHVEACVALFEKQSGKSINLPKNIVAKREYQGIVLSNMCNNRNDADEDAECMIYESIIIRDSSNEADYSQLLENIIDKNLMNDNCTKYFDYGKIKQYIAKSHDEAGLVMRHRAEGDYMIIGYAQPEHTEHRKKIKEIFIDSKVPAKDRDKVWLCAVGKRILWAAGVRRCADFLVDRDTSQLLKLELKQKEE